VKQFSGSRQSGRPTDNLKSGNKLLLQAASVYFVLHSMNALSFIDTIFYGPSWYGRTGDKVSLALNLLGIAASLLLYVSGTLKKNAVRLNRVLPLTAGCLLLISVAWSSDPRLTLTQGTQYFFTIMGAYGLVEIWDSDALLELVALMCGVCAAASIVYFLVFPTLGDFAGIFDQKNVLGQAMAGGVLAGLHGVRVGGGRWFRSVCITALCVIVAFLSKSTTSILTIFVFFLLDRLGRLYLRGGASRITSIFLAASGVSAFIFLAMNSSEVFELLGKDGTLSGRTLFWPYVIDSIFQRPLFGWGYYGFWSPQNPVTSQIAEAIQIAYGYTAIIPNAHNGLLEFLLEVGVVGTSFFLFLFARNFLMAVKCVHGAAKQCGLSSILLLTGIVIVGISEEVLLAAHQIWTSLFFVMGFVCEKELWLKRVATRQRTAKPARLRVSGPVGLAQDRARC
jgi:exopolysaccharide production protein ExoQ